MNTSIKDHSFVPFVLLFTERCGSSYLMEALNSHPEVKAEAEKFRSMARKEKREREPDRQLREIRKFLTRPPENGERAIGFKSKHPDIVNPDGFRVLLQELSVRVIHLSRRNVIKQIVSRFNAIRLNERTGEWNLYNEKDRAGGFEVDPDEFDSGLRRLENQRKGLAEYVETLSLPTVSLQYENLLLNHDVTLHMVFKFLGVGYESVQGVAQKHTSDDLGHVLKNFDELKARYKGTSYERMFEEVLVKPLP